MGNRCRVMSRFVMLLEKEGGIWIAQIKKALYARSWFEQNVETVFFYRSFFTNLCKRLDKCKFRQT